MLMGLVLREVHWRGGDEMGLSEVSTYMVEYEFVWKWDRCK